jgi:hypothetical protein
MTFTSFDAMCELMGHAPVWREGGGASYGVRHGILQEGLNTNPSAYENEERHKYYQCDISHIFVIMFVWI